MTLAGDPRVARVMADRPAFATLERTNAAIGLDPQLRAPPGQSRSPPAGHRHRGHRLRVNAAHDDCGDRPLGQRVVRVQGLHGVPERVDQQRRTTGSVTARTWPASCRQRLRLERAALRHRAGAHLVALKVLDDQGFGFISGVIDAIDYAVANRSALRIRVINLSVGSGIYESYQTDPLTQAAKRAGRTPASSVVTSRATSVKTPRKKPCSAASRRQGMRPGC
jgi:hypothetical protein